jgi:hypothetical protein
MRRIALIPLLALGTIFGFAHGFHALHHGSCGRGGWAEPREVSQTVLAPAPAPTVNPVQVQQQAPAAPAQTLIIPIIVGAPASAAQPTSYVVQVPVAPAPPIAPAPTAPAPR